MTDSLQHHLQERVKELTALHGTSRLLQNAERPLNSIMTDVLALLPPAWQHSDVAEGRIRCGVSWPCAFRAVPAGLTVQMLG